MLPSLPVLTSWSNSSGRSRLRRRRRLRSAPMNYKNITALLVGSLALAFVAFDAFAQTAPASYTFWCAGCHTANPKNDPEKNTPSGGVKQGAGNWNVIESAIIYPNFYAPRPNPMYDT